MELRLHTFSRIAAAGLAIAALAGCREEPSLPSIVVISLDTLRADAVGHYDSANSNTPNIDAFFAEAVSFSRAYAPEPHTLPSHVTLLTSLHPLSHGVTGRLSGGIAISERISTLAELLSRAGYHTAAFVNAGFLDRRFGFDRGFDHFDHFSDIETRSGDDENVRGRSAAGTLRAIFEWIDTTPRAPVFLFLHFFDAHSDWRALPYEAAPEYLSQHFGDRSAEVEARWEAASAGGSTFLEQASSGAVDVSHEHSEEIRSLYQAGVRELDDRFGELMRGLEKRGLYRDAIVLVVADHGEEFQEHGRFLHTQLYEESVRIPMALRLPGRATTPPAERGELVGLIDVVPTLLSALDLKPPPGLQGRDLLQLVEAREGAAPAGWSDRSMYFVSGASGRLAVTHQGWKLFYDATDGSSELYNLAEDPKEERDLSESKPGVARVRRLLLRGWYENVPRPYSDGKEEVVELDADTLEQLKALGYSQDE